MSPLRGPDPPPPVSSIAIAALAVPAIGGCTGAGGDERTVDGKRLLILPR